jgi:hypothetical protein
MPAQRIAALTGLTLAIGLAGPVLGPATTAHAGPLAQTARGVDNRSSSDSKSSAGTQTDDNTVDHRDSSSDRDASGSGTLLAQDSTCYDCEAAPIQLNLGPATWETRFAAQKVRDSDGSFRFNAALLFGQGGAYVSADHYFEHIAAKAANGVMEEDVRVNLVEVAPMLRFVDEPVIKADVRLGFALAASSHFDTLPGGVLGVRLLARANEMMALRVEARAMAYRHDVIAYEGAAGAQYSIAWLGYRALKFDVGPVLEGPEAGLQFSF